MVLINQVKAIMSIKRRDPLGEYQKQKKYAKQSLKNGGLQISRAVDYGSKAINKFGAQKQFQ